MKMWTGQDSSLAVHVLSKGLGRQKNSFKKGLSVVNTSTYIPSQFKYWDSIFKVFTSYSRLKMQAKDHFKGTEIC